MQLLSTPKTPDSIINPTNMIVDKDKYSIPVNNITYVVKERIMVICVSRFLGQVLVKIDSIYNMSYIK